jgi:AcrR family transcriptional regulator
MNTAAMAPRTYNLKRRAETAAATRDRIIEAAAALYRERGVAATTVQAVAERADVARGTVVNHFGGAASLLEAVLDRATDEVEFPVPSHLDGVGPALEERIRAFVDITLRFFERGSDWWQVFANDLELPALVARQQVYWETFATFYAAAFGELAADRVMGAAVRAFVDYGPLHALRSGGLSLDEAIEVMTEALVAIARQRVAMEGRSS